MDEAASTADESDLGIGENWQPLALDFESQMMGWPVEANSSTESEREPSEAHT